MVHKRPMTPLEPLHCTVTMIISDLFIFNRQKLHSLLDDRRILCAQPPDSAYRSYTNYLSMSDDVMLRHAKRLQLFQNSLFICS